MSIDTYGKYAPTPHVIFDRCDLSAEVKWTFAELYRQLWYTDGAYSGSYSKLAELLRLSKNKTYRMIKALETARLLETDSNSDKLSMTLFCNRLWILNGLYESGVDVPYWKDLTTALDTVLKIERQEQEITSIDRDTVLNLVHIGLDLERVVLFLERFGLDLERNVLFLERLKSAIRALEKGADDAKSEAPIISNGNNKSNVNNKGAATAARPATAKVIQSSFPSRPNITPPPNQQNGHKPTRTRQPNQEKDPVITFTPEEQVWFDTIFCECKKLVTVRPNKVTEALKNAVAVLSQHIATLDELNSLYDFTRRQTYLNGKPVYPGNLVSCINPWYQTQQEAASEAKPARPSFLVSEEQSRINKERLHAKAEEARRKRAEAEAASGLAS